jgi:hypothetical protein
VLNPLLRTTATLSMAEKYKTCMINGRIFQDPRLRNNSKCRRRDVEKLLRLKTIRDRAGPVWPGDSKSGLSPLSSPLQSHPQPQPCNPNVPCGLPCSRLYGAIPSGVTAISPQVQPIAQAHQRALRVALFSSSSQLHLTCLARALRTFAR